MPNYEGEPKFYRPAVSRRLYNGKRALMFHNIAPNGSLKYFFKTLSNNRSEYTTSTTPDNLASTVSISDFSTYTSPAFSNAENLISEVYGTGAMSVKGYDREIFVAASGVNRVAIKMGHYNLAGYREFYRDVNTQTDQEVRLEFFALSADQQGNMTQEALTALTRTTPFREKPYIVSIAVGDFDGDKYNNEVALMINSRREIRLFVYRLTLSNGNLLLRSLGDESGMQVYSTNLWANYLEEQPVTDMVAGDFDGDGKSEIVTLLLGYYHYKSWEAWFKAFDYRQDRFSAYPHLAVWTFNRGSIKPIHDDNHVKGGGEAGSHRYNWGSLYDMSQEKREGRLQGLLMNEPFVYHGYEKYSNEDNARENSGTHPDSIRYMFAPRIFSIAAGPFTGKLGTFRTIDDIAVSWRDNNGNDCVTIFKTKLNASKQFDGFEDGKLALREAIGENTWRGLVAVDMAGEGVELGTPAHIRKHSNRSYIAALSAIPYHVDNVSADGTALTQNPVNFTYSDAANGGNMTVSYGSSTTDSTTNTVKQDLSQSVETMFAADPTGTDTKVQETFGKVKGLVGFASAIGDIAHGISVGNMSPEERQRAVWQPESPTAGLTEMMEFFTDKIESIDQRTNSESSTTTIQFCLLKQRGIYGVIQY